MTFPGEHYIDKSAEELMTDAFFIQSIKEPDEETKLFWKNFLREYPGQQKAFDEASSLIRDIKFKKDLPKAGVKEKIWNNIIHAPKASAPVVNMKPRRRWMWAAAAVAGLLFISIAWLMKSGSSSEKNQTAYGEIRQIILPDQSVVTLNANSVLEYKKEWKQGQPREVWLKGEGFFDIKHLNKSGEPIKEFERFIVHAGETSIEVLGTTFNVSDRKLLTQVLLKTGSIKIDFPSQKNASIMMQPGELVNYNQQTKEILKEKVETEKYISWKRRELMLNNTTVLDVVNVIENSYGYKVKVENEEILSRQLSGTGTISLEDEKTLFKALELILNVEITAEDKILRIKSR